MDRRSFFVGAAAVGAAAIAAPVIAKELPIDLIDNPFVRGSKAVTLTGSIFAKEFVRLMILHGAQGVPNGRVTRQMHVDLTLTDADTESDLSTLSRERFEPAAALLVKTIGRRLIVSVPNAAIGYQSTFAEHRGVGVRMIENYDIAFQRSIFRFDVLVGRAN